MLATLNPKQIVDEIVKDTVKDNDPHDAIQISPEIVLASPYDEQPAQAEAAMGDLLSAMLPAIDRSLRHVER